MSSAYSSCAALCAALAALAAVQAPVAASVRGFPVALQADEAAWERTLASSPSSTVAQRDETALASRVHRMGQLTDYFTAQYVRRRLAAAGWDAHIVSYVVPIAWPIDQRLEITAPTHASIDLYEPAIAGDPYSRRHDEIGMPYSGYSADGDVTGPLVYGNYGITDDYRTLARLGVRVKGAIMLLRSGHSTLTQKAFEGAQHGVAAVMIFVDPADEKKPRYPAGPGRPLGSARRNTMTFANPPGDPTAIGVPLPGAPHKPFSALIVPSVPERPVTALVARRLALGLDGVRAPASWRSGIAADLRIDGSERVHFVLRSRRFFGNMWDVIATIKGGVRPEESVIVGGHRDAWTFGAVDPTSGTVDLLQLGDAFGKLLRTGWRPYRSVTIGSWDGEELNLFGSTAWVDQHAAQLRAGCAAYVNTDEVAFGPIFYSYATPDLEGLLREAADSAVAPDGRRLTDYWRSQDRTLAIDAMGGGSDHEPFVFLQGLPALGAGFGGPFGTYHSAYDDLASMRVFDPGYRRAIAAARYTSLVVLRLADAPYPDVRLAALGRAVERRLAQFANAPGSEGRRVAVVRALEPSIHAFAAEAASLDAAADAALVRGDIASTDKARARLRATEAAFLMPKPLPGHGFSRSALYSVSGYEGGFLAQLDDTLDAKGGDAALASLERIFERALLALRAAG